MKTIKSFLPKAVILVLLFTFFCGVIYTAAVTGIAQILFPYQANGSIIEIEGKKYGSALLGQQYSDDSHMWGRIMNIDTTTFIGEDGKPLIYSWPSNLSPAGDEYEALVAKRIEKIRAAHPNKGETAIPVDLVTCSGSGLDPSISIAAAMYQAERIAKNNDMTEKAVEALIDKCTDHRILGIFGEETVNVLKFNLMLDGILK
ncbi:MAG: K(+)-transporting ATPase subunit C [Clostridia bacterium]